MRILQLLWVFAIFIIVIFKSFLNGPIHIELVESEDNSLISNYSMQESYTVTEVYDPVNDCYYTLETFNKLTPETFDNFIGVGEVIANEIYKYINTVGQLSNFYELLNVNGIGEKKLDGILENSK